MPHFRKLKEEIRSYLKEDDFNLSTLPASLQETPIEQWISPLIACLPEIDDLSFRASNMLGYAVSKIFSEEKEKARIIMRRLIWQMNEESGNIGWGIPVAFAECLVQSKGLAEEYHRILISYILELEGDSNYCDYAPLRIYCFHAVEILLDKYPQYRENAKRAIIQGRDDIDIICRNKAIQLIEKYEYDPAS